MVRGKILPAREVLLWYGGLEGVYSLGVVSESAGRGRFFDALELEEEIGKRRFGHGLYGGGTATISREPLVLFQNRFCFFGHLVDCCFAISPGGGVGDEVGGDGLV